MSKKSVILCLLAIIALASFFRLWQIKIIPPGFYPDEAINANNAMETWETKDFKLFYPENNGREGLWINMISPLIAAFGNEPWVPRSLAAIIGILTVIGLFFLTKELFRENPNGDTIALLASFFMAVLFWHINFSRIGFRAILVPFFLVWSFYFLWRAIDKKSVLSSLIFTALAGVLFGLGFYTYISFRIAPLLLIVPFFLLWGKRQKKVILIFLIFAFIAAIPMGIYFLKNPQDFLGRSSQVSFLSSSSPLATLAVNVVKTAGMFFWKGDSNWRHNFSGAPELWWPVAALFLLGMISSAIRIFKNPKSQIPNPKQIQNPNDQNLKQFKNLEFENWNLFGNWKLEIGNLRRVIISPEIFLFAWLLIMLIPTVISNEGVPHALRSIGAIPAVMIFTALGLNWIIKNFSAWLRKKSEQYPEKIIQLSRLKKELILLLLLFLMAVASQSFNQYFFRWSVNPNVEAAFNENYVEIGNYLNTLPNDIPKYVIVNAEGVDVRGIPMPAQTVMFVTKTYLPLWQGEKNIFYINPSGIDSLIPFLNRKEHFYITMLEKDFSLYLFLEQKIPGLKADGVMGSIMLYK